MQEDMEQMNLMGEAGVLFVTITVQYFILQHLLNLRGGAGIEDGLGTPVFVAGEAVSVVDDLASKIPSSVFVLLLCSCGKSACVNMFFVIGLVCIEAFPIVFIGVCVLKFEQFFFVRSFSNFFNLASYSLNLVEY